MKPLGETFSILLPGVVMCVALKIRSILFVLDECRNFFCVAYFGAANLVHSARFGAAFYCFSFAFCSATYFLPLCHFSAGTSSLWCTSVQPISCFLRASVLHPTSSTLPPVQPPRFVGFLTFLYWVLSLSFFSHFVVTYFSYIAVTFFFFINSWVFSCHLSFLLLDEACGRNVFNSTACCSTVCCSLNYLNSFRNVWIPELLLCCVFRVSHTRLFCALRCCLLLLKLRVLFNHLRSSALSPAGTS